MDKRPVISVIVPVYNTEKYLREAVDSVLAQGFGELEIILVDDGSPDNAPAVCDEYASKYGFIRTVHKPNGGLSSARNAGMDIARGEYLLFLDSDDALLPGALERLLGRMDEGVDAVISNVYVKFYESGKPDELSRHIPERELCGDPKEFAVRVLMGRGRAWRAHSNLYRAEVVRRHGVRFPEGHNAEDIVFNLGFYAHARAIGFVNEPTLRYRKRGGSISNSFDPGFMRTIGFIDSEAAAFAAGSGVKEAERFVDSLYMRNVNVFVTSLLANTRDRAAAMKLISSERMRSAAKAYASYPYFEGRARPLYMKTLFVLERLGLRRLALLAAGAAAGRMR